MNNPHPGLPKFDYIKPATFSQASQFLAAHIGEARPLSGGTDIFVRMRDGVWKDKYLVDIKGLAGMGELSFDPVLGLSIGAAVNMNQVIRSPEVMEHYPLLVEFCAQRCQLSVKEPRHNYREYLQCFSCWRHYRSLLAAGWHTLCSWSKGLTPRVAPRVLPWTRRNQVEFG